MVRKNSLRKVTCQPQESGRMESPGKEEKVEVLPCESLGEEEVYRLHQSIHVTTTTLDIMTNLLCNCFQSSIILKSVMTTFMNVGIGVLV